MEQPPVYLSVCAIYRDEAPYMAEWIEFHKLVGVERFFLFNNLSSDDHRDVLALYVEEGTVVLEDWPGDSPEFPAQAKCNFHCVEQHRHETRWLAFIDLDEYLFSPLGCPVSDLLWEFEYAAALWVSRPEFGASGHRTKPPGLVIESYTRRADNPEMQMKRIVDPKRVLRAGLHDPYGGAPSVNTGHEPVRRPKRAPVLDKLRLNHYITKSEEEALVKAQRIRASDGKPQIGLKRNLPAVLERLDQLTDTTIQMYVPALREAMARREGAQADRTVSASPDPRSR
jgi:hypothetical protein